MAKLRMMRPIVRTMDTHTTRLPPRQNDPHYDTAEHAAWAKQVVERAGGRCEALDHYGQRCTKAQPQHRLFADHIREIKDGGSRLDLTNGQCLCGAHHTLKTNAARTKRYESR